jgi:hypothetical protein
MSSAALARAEKNFSSVAMAKQYYVLYERVMGFHQDGEKPE